MSPSRVVFAILAVAVTAACSGDDAIEPATPDTTGSSASTANVTMSAEYTCGPTDGAYISVTVRAARTATLMAELVVDETALGRSEPVQVPAGQETSIGFDPALTDEAYENGSGEVRLRDVSKRGEPLGTVGLEAIDLRLPPGVQCG